MKIWAKTDAYPEGKFLVIRRDGTVFEGPHFVLGPRDPAAPLALRHYARECQRRKMDPEYVSSLFELAFDFEAYYEQHGDGDVTAPPHRRDDPAVISAMRGEDGIIVVNHEREPAK